MRALTGTDPDRLKEEKERGITIDLGFAHGELGEGVVASFVDVPGHERFVRHMLAGAHGIDAVALVVAADESVMPQTREHFHICRLLGVPRGLVVLTKCDLADADSQALAELEARELVAGSFLDGRPVVRVSARTGEGLPALREALLALARETPPRPSEGLLRLPIDRVFSMKGFGTVVTGTLVAGDLTVGEEVEALPSGRRARVRGLQVHGEAVERASAGTRTAVNLAGDVEGLARGEVLARPGTLRATSMIDADLSLLPGARPLADGTRVRVHVASAEVLARVRLLGAESLEPGRGALAQLRLEGPAVAGRGDRLVLRSYSPADTIGGAVVVDPLPPRRRSADRPAGGAAARRRGPAGRGRGGGRRGRPRRHRGNGARGAPDGAARAARGGASRPRDASPSWARTRLSSCPATPSSGSGDPLSPRSRPSTAASPSRRACRARSCGSGRSAASRGSCSSGCSRTSPRRGRRGSSRTPWPPRGTRCASPPARRTRASCSWRRRGRRGSPAWSSRPSPSGRRRTRRSWSGSRGCWSRSASWTGWGRASSSTGTTSRRSSVRVRERWPAGAKVEVGAFKDLTGLSRKYVIPLLEYLDREKVTRRAGNDRIVL